MKTLICAKSEAVVINGDVVVTVINILDGEVVLAFDAPEWVEVFPEEASDAAETIPLAHAKRFEDCRMGVQADWAKRRLRAHCHRRQPAYWFWNWR